MKSSLLALISFLTTHHSLAAHMTYEIVTPKDQSTGIAFQIPYTLGTHDGVARDVTGSVNLDLDHPSRVNGSFQVPILSLRTVNDSMNCHLTEALGIDYTKSKYPSDHVCEDNTLPVSGPDSITYPAIEFNASSLKVSDGKIIGLEGEWGIHGEKRKVNMPVTVTRESNGFKLVATVKLSLADYGIVVKPVRALGIVISSVGETVTVNLDLRFQAPNQPATQ